MFFLKIPINSANEGDIFLKVFELFEKLTHRFFPYLYEKNDMLIQHLYLKQFLSCLPLALLAARVRPLFFYLLPEKLE